MLIIEPGDRVKHSLEGDGTVLRKINGRLLDVLFDESSGVGMFIEATSKNIEAVNGKAVNKRLLKWRPANYSEMSNRNFSDAQTLFLKEHVARITYRPHPFNFEKFKEDYASLTGVICPLTETNRHESAYSDCAEIYFDCYPPSGLFEFSVKQQGNFWFTENVGLAWVLLKEGFHFSSPRVAGVA
jgi:hypothetical protein